MDRFRACILIYEMIKDNSQFSTFIIAENNKETTIKAFWKKINIAS